MQDPFIPWLYQLITFEDMMSFNHQVNDVSIYWIVCNSIQTVCRHAYLLITYRPQTQRFRGRNVVELKEIDTGHYCKVWEKNQQGTP